jgi:hypothetical protein
MHRNHVIDEWGWQAERIRTRHLDRLAVVYVRQSTMQQVLDHAAAIWTQTTGRDLGLGRGAGPGDR